MAKKTPKGKIAAEIGAGLVAAGAAAAAGYYFYGSKQAKKHRKVTAKLANDLKKEVVREAEQLESINSNDVKNVIDMVANTYRGVRSVDIADLKRASGELKANLRTVAREARKTRRMMGKRALVHGKKTVKKITRKMRV